MARTAMPGAAARRERNRREMRASILDAARRIVAEQGAEALTMRAVAGAIGYSAPALYEYFPAKEDLLGCLYFEGSGGFAQRMRETLAALPPAATALERIGALGHAYRGFAKEQPDLFRLVLGQPRPAFSPGFVPPVSNRAPDGEESDAFALLVEAAGDGIARGEFAPQPPTTIALGAWSVVHGFVMLELTGHLVDAGEIPPARALSNGAGPAPPSADDLFAATLAVMGSGIARR